jgi:O-methyltransferase
MEKVMNFHLDALTHNAALGWALSAEHAGKISVEIHCDNVCIGAGVADRERQDIGTAFPAVAGAKNSGFYIPYKLPARRGADKFDITVLAWEDKNNPNSKPVEIARRSVVTAEAIVKATALTSSSTDQIISPFPREVIELVVKLWPEQLEDIEQDNVQQSIADKIVFSALSVNGLHTVPALLKYIGFLRLTWEHCKYVERYFPSVNINKSAADKDWRAKQNSAQEMMSIIHHLYVLKSYGIVGDFAEFGCFKGFSSSMLSYACKLLDMRMHIFDSFAGLPESESYYYKAGDFLGSLTEVKNNVNQYGAADVCSFYKGYFSESLKSTNVPKLAALWLDVDLASSATDVMSIAQAIDVRGAIFSHECGPANFAGGAVVAGPRGADNVVPAIVDFFDGINEKVGGRYVTGHTGSFWRKASGIPVLSNTVLARLIVSI